MSTQLLRWFAAAALLITTPTMFAAVYDVIDPNGLDSEINSLGFVLVEEVGNYTINAFNNHPHRKVFTFEAYNGFGPEGDQLHAISLTSDQSGIDLTVTFDIPRDSEGLETGWGRVTTVYFPTGGLWSLAYKTLGTSKIMFNTGVYGVGLCFSRTEENTIVRLRDVNGDPIGSDYVVMANGSSGHSFFGYYDPFSPAVGSIEFVEDDTVAANQFAIDDVVVIGSTSGLASCFSVAQIGDINEDCMINLNDFALLAGQWMLCNHPDDPSCGL